jgi:hypothetical protein
LLLLLFQMYRTVKSTDKPATSSGNLSKLNYIRPSIPHCTLQCSVNYIEVSLYIFVMLCSSFPLQIKTHCLPTSQIRVTNFLTNKY